MATNKPTVSVLTTRYYGVWDIFFLRVDKIVQDDLFAVEAQPTCYMCGNTGEMLYNGLEDYLFGAPGKWSFKKCSNSDCGHIWLDPAPTRDTISKAYQNYYTHGQPNSVQYTLLARMIRSILHPVSIRLLRMRSERKKYKYMFLGQVPAGRLLEVGCGNGKRLVRMRALGWEVMGQEVDALAAKHASNNCKINVHLGPLETLPSNIEKFDAVIMSHVIEHVHDPVALLLTCHRFLKENGLLVIMTPNAASYGHRKFGKLWRGLEPPRHLHLFTCNTLAQIVNSAGFKRQNCRTIAVGANGIGQGSHLPIRKTASGFRIFTVRDVLRGIWFQVTSTLILSKTKDSGEECVLKAYK